MKISFEHFDFNHYNKVQKHKNKINYAEIKAQNDVSNVNANEFADQYSQAFISRYIEKEQKIKKTESFKNAFSGALTLLIGTVFLVLFSKLKK